MIKYGLLVIMVLVMAGCAQIPESETTTTGDVAMTDTTTTTGEVVEDEIMDGTYRVIPEESLVKWMGAKVIGDAKNGTVMVKEGGLEYIQGVPSKGALVLDMTTIKHDGGSQGLEDHLKNEDFFAVDQYPDAIIVLSGFVSTGENLYEVMADLTIKGQTHPVVFTASMVGMESQANIVIDRAKWDIRYGSDSFFDDLGDSAIKDEIEFDVMLKVEKE